MFTEMKEWFQRQKSRINDPEGVALGTHFPSLWHRDQLVVCLHLSSGMPWLLASFHGQLLLFVLYQWPEFSQRSVQMSRGSW
jgi:hypothetical protein